VEGIQGLLGRGFWRMWVSACDLGIGYGIGDSVIDYVGGW
jgi:hypothetical protein